MPEIVKLNYEFRFLLKSPDGEIYDLSAAESITDNFTTNTTDINRYSYKGATGRIPTSYNFTISVVGTNDQNDKAYQLFKGLYGGELANLQGYTAQMVFPQVDGEATRRTLTVPVAISFTAGFAGTANELSRYSVDLVANGAISTTETEWNVISLKKKEINVELDSSEIVEIENTDLDFSTVSVQSADPNIATATMNTDLFAINEIVITAVSGGTTFVTVKAPEFRDAKLKVNVIKIPFDIPNKDLGLVDDNSESTIRKTITLKNPEIVDNMYELTNITETNATANGIGNYEGTVVVSFVIRKEILLSKTESTIVVNEVDNIEILNLAELDTPQVDTVDKEIATASLNQNIISIKGVDVGVTTGSVSAKNADPVEIKITVDSADISSIITNLDLGELNDNKETTITAQILAKNPLAKAGDFSVENITTTGAHIIGVDRYTGSVDVVFTLKQIDIVLSKNTSDIQIDQTDTITITNFDQLINPKQINNDPTIFNSQLTTNEIGITGLSDGSGTITVDADNGNDATITINVVKIPLVIGETNLGLVDDNSESTIRKALITKNPTITDEMYEVNDITETSAQIVGINKWTGTTTITFMVFHSIELDKETSNINYKETDIITITNFSQLFNVKAISKDTNIVTVNLNTNTLTINTVMVGKTVITVSADNSDDKTIDVTVNAININSVITETELGELESVSQITIKNAILTKNPNVKADDFEISGITLTQATVTGKGNYNGSLMVTYSIKKIDIELSKETSTVEINQNDTITVINADDLLNPKVVSSSEAIATATLSNGTITITGITEGTTTATVSADNGNSKTISITVSKIKLVITNTDLGVLADNEEATIRSVVKEKNPTITDDMYDLAEITTTTANAVGKGIYTGTVPLTFMVHQTITVDKPTLAINWNQSDTITITNYADLFGVQVAKGNENIEMTVADAVITVKGLIVGASTITISATNADNLVINITINAVPLNTLITETALGEVENLNDDVITNAVIAKNPTATANDFTITTKTSTGATLTGKGNYNGTVEVTYSLKIIDVVTDKDALTVKVGGTGTIEVVNLDQIINFKYGSSNNSIASLTISDNIITVTGVAVGTARCEITGDNVNTKNVAITIEPATAEIQLDKTETTLTIDEKDVVTITNFNELVNVKAVSNNPAIATAELIFLEGQINISAIAKGSTTVTVSADNATGNKDITVTVNTKSFDIPVKELGLLDDNQEATIRAAITSKNPTITDDMYDLTAITETSATATGKGAYEGTAEVTFTTRKELSTVITVTDLGSISDNSAATIKTEVIIKNANVRNGDFNVQTGSITETSAILEGIGNYKGTVNITFTISVDIKLSSNDFELILSRGMYIKVLNFAELINVNVSIDNDNISVKLGDTDETKDQINLFTVFSSEEAIITVSADNATNNALIQVQTVENRSLLRYLINRNLGILSNNAPIDIYYAIYELNPDAQFIRSDLAINNITETSADAVGTTDHSYIGTVPVSFTIRSTQNNEIKNLDKEKK